ncbi:MAG: sulfite exporter TauE/SafE family protein [Planctomycetaceae bacterium]|nr:sulfite exporter TauE/SafE family protein [Planctomycetaceae bacterium]
MEYVWLCLSALLAGAVNALAGGGTLLTFPTLMGVLIPQVGKEVAGVLANGTSTTSLVPASLGSAWGFRRELYHLRRFLVYLLPPSIVGAVIGTLLVTRLPPEYFNRLVPWLILTAAVLFTLQPYLTRRKPQVVATDEPGAKPHGDVCDADTPIPRQRLARMIAMQLLIAIYGGYFGAGIGILMLAGLGLMGLSNIHQMNGLKAVLGTAINGVSVLIWAFEGKIVWPYALAMMATSVVGGFVAAHYSRQVPGKFVRWLVIVVGFCLAVYYFGKQL